MDGVLVDFDSALSQQSEVKQYEGRFDEIPGLFGLMKPMPGAIDAVHRLNEFYSRPRHGAIHRHGAIRLYGLLNISMTCFTNV